MKIEEILAAIARASATSLQHDSIPLPLAAYGSRELYELEVERIFRPGWLLAGHVDMVAQPNSFHSVDLVGEPILLARDEEGVVKVFSRLCPHRGMELIHGSGEAKRISCPYHRWTFALSGECRGAPSMNESVGFRREDYGLHPIRFEIWHGFVFVNLDGKAMPLAPKLASLYGKIEERRFADMTPVHTIDFGELAMDWKILLENSIECYHHAGAHSETLQQLFPAELSWADVGHEEYGITYSVAKADVEQGAKGRQAEAIFNQNTGWLLHVFPFTRFALRKENMTHFQMFPLEAGKIRLLVHLYLPKDAAAGEHAEEMIRAHETRLRRILGEDIDMCERMQRMSTSQISKVGRLSQLEEPLWNFYKYLARCLADKSKREIKIHSVA